MGCSVLGEVRKCKHAKSMAMRAVQIQRKDKMGKFEIDRFTHQVEVMKRLDHPNIIKLYEMYEDEKRFFLSMELCTGGELFDEISLKDKFDEETCSIITQQLLGAIGYCHRQGIVHRDLKPENILFDAKKSKIVKIKDFAASAVYQMNEKNGKDKLMLKETVGSAYYVAPEILIGEYNEKCDIWSIGVILFIMLAGRPPFEGSNELEIVKNVMMAQIDFDTSDLAELSDEAKDLLMNLLTLDP